MVVVAILSGYLVESVDLVVNCILELSFFQASVRLISVNLPLIIFRKTADYAEFHDM